MKTLMPVVTLALAALFAAPVAEARCHPSRSYVSFHRSCGGPAWIETYVAFYDACGYPVFRTRVVPIRRCHRPVHRHPAPYFRGRCR